MKELTMVTPGSVGPYVYDPTKPTFWTEQLSYWFLAQIAAFRTNGFKWRYPENTDYDDTVSAFSLWTDQTDAWFDAAVAARDAGLPIPSPPTVPDMPTGGGFTNIIVGIVIKAALELVLKKTKKWFDPTTDAGEIAEVLRQALLSPENPDSTIFDSLSRGTVYSVSGNLSQIRTVLVGLRDRIASSGDDVGTILKDALLSPEGNALIDALAAVGLHINFSAQQVSADYADD